MARIFLCHANEDKAKVREVYHRLRAIEGFEPWLDEEDLLPGQEWAQEIPRALKNSDFILIFLSRTSVARRGYVQREMKMALDAWEELPGGTIHTIPVRLDDCDVPEPFRRYPYANLLDPRGFDRLTQAIQTGLTRQRPYIAPQLTLEPPPDLVPDRGSTISGAQGQSNAETSVRPTKESGPSPSELVEIVLKSIRQSISYITKYVFVERKSDRVGRIRHIPQEYLPQEYVRRVKRYTKVEFPERCSVNIKAILRIQLTLYSPEDTIADRLIKVPFLEDSKETILVVYITAPAFKIDHPIAMMRVPVNEDSEEVAFEMTPVESGRQVIEIEMFFRSERVGYFTVESEVIGYGQ